jgi:hypothetical protein
LLAAASSPSSRGSVERSNVEQAAALHLTSQLEGIEIERFGWRLPRLAVIPNAIDEPSFQNGKIASDVEAITSQQPLVLFLGRLSWKKGLDRLLRAFARTRAGILAVVGNDDENFARQLVKLAADLQIADRVRILPRIVIGSEKERLFAAARLFVLPSYSKNFGNTVLEVTPEVGAAKIVRKSGAGWAPRAAWFGHRPVDRRPQPRAIHGQSRTRDSRAFQLGSRRCPDGRFVQQPQTSSPRGRRGRTCKCLIKLPRLLLGDRHNGVNHLPATPHIAFGGEVRVEAA